MEGRICLFWHCGFPLFLFFCFLYTSFSGNCTSRGDREKQGMSEHLSLPCVYTCTGADVTRQHTVSKPQIYIPRYLSYTCFSCIWSQSTRPNTGVTRKNDHRPRYCPTMVSCNLTRLLRGKQTIHWKQRPPMNNSQKRCKSARQPPNRIPPFADLRHLTLFDSSFHALVILGCLPNACRDTTRGRPESAPTEVIVQRLPGIPVQHDYSSVLLIHFLFLRGKTSLASAKDKHVVILQHAHHQLQVSQTDSVLNDAAPYLQTESHTCRCTWTDSWLAFFRLGPWVPAYDAEQSWPVSQINLRFETCTICLRKKEAISSVLRLQLHYSNYVCNNLHPRLRRPKLQVFC